MRTAAAARGAREGLTCLALLYHSRSGGGGGIKLLLLALLVGLAALAGLTLSAAAQSGADGSDDADPQGRIIARIQDRSGDDGVDNYRIEFGFFPEWAMDDKDPWAEAVAAWSDWLPRARYLTKTVIDRRAADDNRRWLRSSLISVPAGASAQPGGGTGLEDGGANGQSLIEGRVIARYSPDSRDRLRIEFGFLPEWAFIRTADTEEAVEQYSEDFLPRARYISASMIESRRGVWLRSSVVELTPAPQPPVINSISCPSSADVDESVACTASLSGGEPDAYAWSDTDGGSGSSASYSTSFSAAGAKTISLTVRNSAGSDSDSAAVTVNVNVEEPLISVSCPSSADVDENITCTVDNSGGAIDTYSWSDSDGGTGSSASYSTSFSSSGEKTVSLTARNSAGSDSDSATLAINVEAPAITVSCPSAAATHENITCTADNSGGAIDAYSWSDSDGGSGSSASYSTSFSASGEKTVSLTARNAAGSDSDSAGLTVTGAPQINLNCPSVADVDERITCTVSNSGDTIDSYSWRDSDGGTGSGSSYSTSFSSSGAKTIRVTARNSAGSDSDSASLRVTGAPQISVNCPSSAAVDESITCTASNSGGAIDSYAWSDSDGGSGSSASYSTSFSAAGAKTVSLTARNAAGSDSDSAGLTVTAAPQISISCPSSAAVDESVTCTVSNSGGPIDSYAWSDEDGGSGSGSSYSASFSSSGAKTIRLTVRNAAGSDSDSTTLTVQLLPPVIDSINCSPSQPAVDETVTCTVSAGGGAIDSYEWSGGGSSSGRQAAYSTSFNLSGPNLVSLSVSNSAGTDSESVSVQVRMEISISCPATAEVNATITCTVTSRRGPVDSYAWSDSDGGSGSSASYSTYFGSAGEHTVSLTVLTYDAGSSSDSTTVEVQARPGVQLPAISISCPSTIAVQARLVCTMSNSGGEIDSYSWSNSDGGGFGAVASSGLGPTYTDLFWSPGTKTVSLTVRNSAGTDTASTTLVAQAPPGLQPPVITISCPSTAVVGETVTCTMSNSGGPISQRWWTTGGDLNVGEIVGNIPSLSTSFSSPGAKTIYLTARNAAGFDSDSTTVEVRAASP